MLKSILHYLSRTPNSEEFFYQAELLICLVFMIAIWILRPKSPESNFKVREADRLKNSSKAKPGLSKHRFDPNPRLEEQPKFGSKLRTESSSEFKTKKESVSLQLPGIRIDGLPHEILGVHENATLKEIQKAYRNLMKKYHPDRVDRPGSQQWTDSQEIAEAINHAKDAMIQKIKSSSN